MAPSLEMEQARTELKPGWTRACPVDETGAQEMAASFFSLLLTDGVGVRWIGIGKLESVAPSQAACHSAIIC